MSQLGIERAAQFTWEPFRKLIVEQAEESIRAHKERRAKGQEAGPVEETRNESDSVRRSESEDSTTESHSLIKRTVEDIEREAKTYKARA
jgi:hypothetical protein